MLELNKKSFSFQFHEFSRKKSILRYIQSDEILSISRLFTSKPYSAKIHSIWRFFRRKIKFTISWKKKIAKILAFCNENLFLLQMVKELKMKCIHFVSWIFTFKNLGNVRVAAKLYLSTCWMTKNLSPNSWLLTGPVPNCWPFCGNITT